MKKLKKILSALCLYSLVFNNIIAQAIFINPGFNTPVTSDTTIEGINLIGTNTGATISGTGQVYSTGDIIMDGSGLFLNINSGATLTIDDGQITMSGTNNNNNNIYINGSGSLKSTLKVRNSLMNNISNIFVNNSNLHFDMQNTQSINTVTDRPPYNETVS